MAGITTKQDKAAADLAALKASGLPIALYGDGWYAPYVREFLARNGLKAAASFVDDGCAYSEGTVGFEEIRRRFEKFNIVVAFANFGMAREKLGRKDGSQVAGVYSFDVIGTLLGYRLDRAWLERNRERLAMAYGLLADGLSRETWAAFVNAKLGGGTEGLNAVKRKDQYFPEGIIKLGDSEVFVDGGAYTGDTLQTFIRKTEGRYAGCRAFEPEPAAAAKLGEMAARRGFPNVRIFNKGLWSKAGAMRFTASEGMSSSAISETGAARVEVTAIDEAAPDATFIKLDVEGAELEALKGATATIRRNRPKLAVCVYHKPEDLFEIPLFIKELAPEYRFYLRQHQPVTCELVLYAVL